jgi:uncharacterized repeat protein (TIGR03803 family)
MIPSRLFKLTPSGTETVLHSFTAGSDGANPVAGLIADGNGNLYGTTSIGGGGSVCGAGCGVVFRVSPSGTETVLYSFMGGSDGISPTAGLIADSSGGNLYGTIEYGGHFSAETCLLPFLCYFINGGTVFKLSPGGTETVLHNFGGGSDGIFPAAGLIADSSGNFYGTTYLGGAPGYGTVFKIAPGGTETVLYSFCSLPSCSDGAIPVAGLIADSSGNLYGTTEVGGASNDGVVFELTGTGFVPVIPFAAFGAKLAIQFGTTPNHDFFEMGSSFTLGSASNGINPAAERVTLQIGTFAVTIPPGSFTGKGFGPFYFAGTISGVALDVVIAPEGTKRYALRAGTRNTNLTGTVNPVPVTLTIGDDSGTISVTAVIASGVAMAH